MRPPPVHIRVGPDTHPPDARVAAWRAALGFSHEVIVADRPGFRAGFDGHHLGPILLADISAAPHTAVRDRAHVARHALDAVALDVFLEGGLAGRFGSRTVAVEPGDALLFDLRDTMHVDLTDHRCLSLVVPRPLFAARAGQGRRTGARVFRTDTAEAALLGGLLRHLVDAAPHLTEPLAEAAGLAALDLLAACVAPREARNRRIRAPGDPAPQRARVERFISANLARPDLGPALLCRHFRVSRSVLYALMQPLGGVASVVRRHRLDAARRLLGSDEGRALPVEALARRCGFGDAQALRRALKDAGAASPRDLRAAGVAPDEVPPPVDPETSAWIDAV